MLLNQTFSAIANESTQLSISADETVDSESPLDRIYNVVSQNERFKQIKNMMELQWTGSQDNNRNEGVNGYREQEEEINEDLDSEGFLSISNFKDIDYGDN